MKLPAPIRDVVRDNAFLAGCLVASVLFNLLVLFTAQRAAERGGVIVVRPVPAAAGTPIPKELLAPPDPAAKKVDKLPPDAKLVPPEKKNAPPQKPAEKKEAPKPAEKKEPPKRVLTEKKAEAAKKPSDAKPGDADLVPLACEAPQPMGVDMAQLLRIQIENQGTATAGAHRDAVFFSTDDKLDEKDASLGLIEAGGTLAPKAKTWVRAQVLLPDKTPSGPAYLIIVLNADGQMPETNHANNQLVVPIMVDAQYTPLGDPNERPRSTVAWISSKDFRELKARQSRTLQPAVQNETEAQKEAKLHNQPGEQNAKPVDPVVAKETPKAPTKVADPAKQEPKAAPVVPKVEAPPEVSPKVAVKPEPKPEVVAKKDPKPEPKQVSVAIKQPDRKGPKVEPKSTPKPVAKADPKPPEKTVAKTDTKTQPRVDPKLALATNKPSPQAATPSQEPVKDPAKPDEKTPDPAVGLPKPKLPVAATEGAGETATPRDTSSAPATQLEESDLEMQPGRVLVGKGVKINTMRIRPPGPAALIAGASANPRVAVSFAKDGSAIKVDLLRSSGNPDWDAAVQQSLYRWTAEGEQVEKGGLVIRWTVLLGAAD